MEKNRVRGEDYESEDMYWEEDTYCDYGFEFCVDPQIRDMGLCTTECEAYLDAVAMELDANQKKIALGVADAEKEK